MTLASELLLQKFLQHLSAPVYRLTLTGREDLDFS
jgi:hypothetical protein